MQRERERVTETEKSLLVRDTSHIGMPSPTFRWTTHDLPSLEPPKPSEDNPPTLAGQLMRNNITQSEYDTSLDNMQPLTKKSGKGKEEERRAREHFLLGMIEIHRKMVIEAVLEAKSKTPEEIEETRQRKLPTQGPESPRKKRE